MPNRIIDISGQRFGKLVAIEIVGKNRKAKWRCRCDCGNEAVVLGNKLRNGHTKSCGCLRMEMVLNSLTKHGHTAGGARSPEYSTWTNMRTRCNNPENDAYTDYGARGITVFPEWNDSFDAFLAYVGPRPSPDHTLDRIDPAGNYEPGNVRWLTKAEQARNTRRNRNFTHGGLTLCAAEWDRRLGFKRGTVLRRIDVNEWDVHKALTTPQALRVPAPARIIRASDGCANQEPRIFAGPEGYGFL